MAKNRFSPRALSAALPDGVTIKTVFRTEDGETHESLVQAAQHIAFQKLCESIQGWGILRANPDSSDVANAIADHADVVREYLDSCDSLRRETNEVSE